MDFHQPFFSLFLFFILFFPHFSHSTLHSSDFHQTTKTLRGSVLELTTGVPSGTFDPTRVTQVSWHPRAFIYRNFLTDEECDHLISLAKNRLKKSMVADFETGKSIPSEVRTSSGMFLKMAQDEIVAGIELRIAAWTFLPIENGEPIQILHYEHGQKYDAHFDYFHDKHNQELGGHRVAIVLMYLSNVEKGGKTVFPFSEKRDSLPKDDNISDCTKNGYSVKPHKGDVLLFFSLHPNATTDRFSLHGSCPVIEGEKWSATKWIHVRSFERRTTVTRGGGCSDDNENCPQWAAAGECEKNPTYMVGNTIQRSSYSFRRQGSSGHIWENNLHATKSGEMQNGGKINQERRFSRELRDNEKNVHRKNSVPLHPAPSRKQNVEQSYYCVPFLRSCCG